MQAQKNLEGAIDAFKRATTLQPNSGDAQTALAETLFLKGDYKQAIISYQRLIEINPQNPQAYYKLAAALKKDNRQSDAIAALEKARDLYRSQGQSEGVQKAESALRELKPSS